MMNHPTMFVTGVSALLIVPSPASELANSPCWTGEATGCEPPESSLLLRTLSLLTLEVNDKKLNRMAGR